MSKDKTTKGQTVKIKCLCKILIWKNSYSNIFLINKYKLSQVYIYEFSKTEIRVSFCVFYEGKPVFQELDQCSLYELATACMLKK